MQICPNCGEENPARFRLCGFCGTPLAPATPGQEIRKTVTIVFSDLKGSTDLAEKLDSEALRELMTRYFETMRAELERHGGTIEKYIGDAIMAVFGLPALHEDDALRAVRAAAGMQRALASLNDELDRVWGVRLANRTGVNTGEVVAGDPTGGQRLVTGDAVNTAARLEQAAPTNEILIAELTYRLVRDAVEIEPVDPLELKGKSERVAAYRLLGVREPGAGRTRDLAPLVGRRAEVGQLRETFGESAEAATTRLVTVIGDAGVGKSRLIREFLASVQDDALIVHGRCLPYGRGITFWPILEIARGAAGIEEDDPPERARAKLLGLLGDEAAAERIASAIGLTTVVFPLPELFWAIGRMVAILAERGSLVLVIDDIHWAEATLLDLIEHLRTGEASGPVLILCTARHDLLEERPNWADGPGERIVLGPLDASDVAALVEGLLGQTGIPQRILDRVIEAAEGNPLFVEQLVSMLVDEGVLRRVEGAWRLADEVREVMVPPTIQALLAARLDRLGRDERAVVEPASVIGLVFQESAVRWLASQEVKDALPDRLSSLDRKQFVHPTTPATEEDATYRFHHILIRDAAYAGQLKRARATLHERFVEWADDLNAGRDRALEFEEILGYHLEMAHRYLAELGPLDDHGIQLGIRASERLAAAGRRAFARGDLPATIDLLRRAAADRPAGDPLRPVLLIETGEAMTNSGDLAPADEILRTAQSEAAAIGDAASAATAGLGLIYLHYLTEGDEPEAEVIAKVQAAIVILDAVGDERGQSRAWRILAQVHVAACRYLDATVATEQMIQHARAAGDRGMELRALPVLAACAQVGPTPVPEAIAIAEDVLIQVAGDRKAEAHTLRALANLEAMVGRFDEARAHYRRGRAILEELGWGLIAAFTSATASGPVELIAGDALAAERELRGDYESLAAMGERNFISTTAAFLAEALYRQDRDAEALAMTQESEAIAAADDVATQYLWRTVRAKLLARAGAYSEAEALSNEAIAIIEAAQDPDSQGYAYLDLSDVLRFAGRSADAVAAAETAIERFETKGNLASAARARAAANALLAAGQA